MFIACDIGGTEIKAGIVSEQGKIIGSIQHYDSYSERDSTVILSHFMDVIEEMAGNVPENTLISGIGMAFPGDFDYENGISLIDGLGKFAAIYQMNIKEELFHRINERTRLENRLIPGYDIVFIHDIAAFLLGNIKLGMGNGKIIALCIGTGAGSSFADKGMIIGDEVEGVPYKGWIYNTAFRESIIDDYVSVRGLRRITEKYFPSPVDGKALYKLAEGGNTQAKTVFQEFGKIVAEAMIPFLLSFRPRTLLLGGQITKSFQYFGSEIKGFCDLHDIKIEINRDSSRMALIGMNIFLTGDTLGGESHTVEHASNLVGFPQSGG